MTTTAVPRHALVDALRGLALFGILVVNLEFIAVAPFRGWEGFDQWWDLGARWVTITFFQLKSYLVFALLFGYGLSIMIGRRDDEGFRARYLRRMAVLLVLGLLHAVFLFVGDILVSYAILGALLLGVARWPARRLLRLAAALYAIAIATVGLVALEIAAGSAEATGEDARALVYAEGSFLEVARQRLEDLPIALGVIGVLNWASIGAAFCVGVVIGRGDVLSNPARHQFSARRLALWCLPVGFGLSGLAGVLTLSANERTSGAGPALGLLIENVAAPIAVAGVVAGLVVASQTGWWPSLERRVTAGGRSSLSIVPGRVPGGIAALLRLRSGATGIDRADGRARRCARTLAVSGGPRRPLDEALSPGSGRVAASFGDLLEAAEAASGSRPGARLRGHGARSDRTSWKQGDTEVR